MKEKKIRLAVQIKGIRLAAIVIILLFALSFVLGYFVSWQIGIPTLIFGLSFALLYKLTMLSKKFSPMFLFILGISFTFTVYSPIHESIHLLLAHACGAPVSKVEWWFLTDSGIQNPNVTVDLISKNVLWRFIVYRAPFVAFSVVFISLWYYWYIRKSLWMHFAYVPLSFNFALSQDDLFLSQIAGLATSSFLLVLMLVVTSYYSKIWQETA